MITFGSDEAAAIVASDKIKQEAKETRRKSVGQATCKCGRTVTLWAETEEWYQLPNGKRWYHAAYGTGTGECECGLAIVELMDGRVVALEKANEQDNRQPPTV
jgi:hypothetical protein